MKSLKEYIKKKKIEFYENQIIKPYVSMKIGGPVKLIIIIYNLPDLSELLLHIYKNKHNFILLGGGSNVLFSDNYSDLIVIINRTSEINKQKKNILKLDSGVLNRNLLKYNIQNNIGGMEFLAGIPGTIGGGAAVNAGAFGKSISDTLEKAEILTREGKIVTVNKKYFEFNYRDSVFKLSNQVILNVSLKFNPSNSKKINERIKSNIEYRKKNHPTYNNYTVGCFFKNPLINNRKISAGEIIENSGLKGIGFNHLQISNIHANFIINKGQASFDDIVNLEKRITKNVFKKKGIKLEREVIYISQHGKKY